MTEALQEELKTNGVSSESSADSATSQGHQVPLHDETKPRRPSVDRDAQDMVIDSLRMQIQDLISQVSQLNSKLVKSYDRVSDLEDDIHVANANLRTSSLKISQLELERTQHLSALNTGLLVEKSHVTAELNRLMEKATEEAAQRGQAESARIAIEKDLDDLSATLFGQANSMVAEARFAQYQSDRKREDSEVALKGAEEAVQLMQVQMQNMQTEREEVEKKMHEMQVAMGKGKWVNRGNGPEQQITLKFLNSHAPFQEFTAFVAHLRVLHSSSPNPPAMSTFLPLPFLARLLTEDSEPTIRLDLAPSLNWLSRRSVLAAIHSGQLTIEPISTHTLIHDLATQSSTTTIAGMNTSGDIMCCALCGSPVLTVSEHSHLSRPAIHAQGSSWSTSFFKRNSTGSLQNSQPPSPTRQNSVSTSNHIPNTQVYIFRMASQSATAIPSLPIPTLSKSASPSPSMASHSGASSSYNTPLHSQIASPSNQTSTIYPLCQNGWCLTRLRTTCTLWAYVRTNVVDKVWDEELPPPPQPTVPLQTPVPEKPPIPPRKRGLWGIASAIGERAASWGDSEKDKGKKGTTQTATPVESRRLPPPLPPTPAVPAQAPPPLPSRPIAPAPTVTTAPEVAPIPEVVSAPEVTPAPIERVVTPPPPPAAVVEPAVVRAATPPTAAAPAHEPAPASEPMVTPAPAPAATTTPIPPPLPRRADGRSRTTTATNDHTPRSSLDQSRDAARSPPPAATGPPPLPEKPRSTSSRPSSPKPSSPKAIPTSGHKSTPSSPKLPPTPSSPLRKSHFQSMVPERSRTPTNIPLPDSRPGTPNAIARATSPAGGAGGVGGATPPPLPRRAAARSRGGPAPPSRSATPSNCDAAHSVVAVVENAEEKKEEVKVEEVVDNNSKESESVVKAQDPEIAVPVVPVVAVKEEEEHESSETRVAEAAVARSSQESPGSDVFVDAESGIASSTASLEAPGTEGKKFSEEEKPIKEATGTTETEKRLSAATITNGNVATANVENPKSSPESVSNGVAVEVTAPTPESFRDVDKEVQELSEEPVGEESKSKDEAGYLGDATWEERTWKEIVRLREDMFFARVGVVRE